MSLQGEAPQIVIDGLILDPYRIATPLAIRVGRSSPNEQPEANTATWTFLGELPEQILLGAPVDMSIQEGDSGLWGGTGTYPDTGGDIWQDLWSPLAPKTLGLLPENLTGWTVVAGPATLSWSIEDLEIFRASLPTGHPAAVLLAPAWGWDAGDVERTLTMTFQLLSNSYATPISAQLGLWGSATNATPVPADGLVGESAALSIPPGSGPSSAKWLTFTVTIPDATLYVRPFLRINAPMSLAGSVDFGPYTAILEQEGEGAEAIKRFTGRITDLAPIAEAETLKTQITATGNKSDLGRLITGSTQFAAEPETERLIRFQQDAELRGVDLVGTGASWYHATRYAKRERLLTLLHEMAVSGALLHEACDGVIYWEAWDYRSAAETDVELSSAFILDGVSWSQQIGSFVKRVLVRYGTVPSSGDPGAAKPIQLESIQGPQGIDKAEVAIDTTLRDLVDADQFGALVLSRWGDQTQWEAPTIGVPMWLVDEETWDALMGLQVSNVIETEGVTERPTPLPYGSGKWFIEGWEESWDRAGDGPILQDVHYAVSHYERFRPDAGLDTQIINVAVAPVSAKYGVARTITGSVRVISPDAPVTDGMVVLRKGSRDYSEAAVNVSTGAFSILLDGGDLSPGDHELTVHYEGVYGFFRRSEADVELTVTQPDTDPGEVRAMISFTVSPNTVKQGGTFTLEANTELTDGTRQPTGEYRFQISRNNGGSWSTIDTKRSADGHATTRYGAARPDDPIDFRCVFDADRGGVADVTSASRDCNVLGKSSKTKTYGTQWGATYKANGSKRTDAGGKLYQGYVSGTNGDQRSLAGFSIPNSDWNGWTITKVEVRLRYLDWWKSSGGTALIGSHSHSSEPGANPNISARKSKVKMKANDTRWINITSWGKGLATGNMKGICLGPAGNQSTEYYGHADGAGSNEPQIRISGYHWT